MLNSSFYSWNIDGEQSKTNWRWSESPVRDDVTKNVNHMKTEHRRSHIRSRSRSTSRHKSRKRKTRDRSKSKKRSRNSSRSRDKDRHKNKRKD